MNSNSDISFTAYHDILKKILDTRPKMYYATDKNIERGTIYFIEETAWTTECFVCHPDDLECLMIMACGIDFVPLADMPREEIERKLQEATQKIIEGMTQKSTAFFLKRL